jgi:hypothetical protein
MLVLKLTAEELIEKIALETFPTGELVWACAGPGPARRGLLFRTNKPFPPKVYKLTALGRRFELRAICDDKNQVLVTWSPVTKSRLKH